MTEPTARLGAAFEAEARSMRVPAADVTDVVRRGRRRQTRQRRAVAGLVALSLVSAAVGIARLGGSTPETTVASEGGTSRGPLGITWREVHPDSALSSNVRGVSAGRPLYALSTGPGERWREGSQPSRVVWRSDDGVEWAAVSTLGDDLFLADLTAPSGRVYAVGTAPGDAQTAGRRAVPDLVVGWSDDDGARFSRTKLPVDTAALARHNGRIGDAEIASGPAGVLAVASMAVELDVPRLLPEGESAPHGWATTDTGVDILGPPRDDVCPEGSTESKEDPDPRPAREIPPTWCSDGEQGSFVSPQDARGVTRSFTWHELGVEGDLLAAARRTPVAFRAAAGATKFERIDLPAIPNVLGEMLVEATSSGFQIALASVQRYGMSQAVLTVLQSSDGGTWQRSTPSGGGWTMTLGELDGRSAVLVSTEQGGRLLLSDGNGGWRGIPLSDVVDPAVRGDRLIAVTAADIGPFGIAVGVTMYSPDRDRGQDDPRRRVLVSRDGSRWEDLALDDLVSEDGGIVTRVAVTDEIVLGVSLPDKSPGPGREPVRRQIALVGRA